MRTKATLPLLWVVLTLYCLWSNRIGVLAREITNKRKLLVSDCSGAKVECAAECGSDGIDDFVCDEPGWFTSGSFYCLCNSPKSSTSSSSYSYPSYPSSGSSYSTPSSSYSTPSGRRCFSGSSIALTETGQQKMMRDLKLGDRVLSVNAKGQPVFSPVYLFSSYRPQEIASFVRVSTEAGLNVTLTPDHYLFVHRGSRSEAAAWKTLSDWEHLLPNEAKIGDYVPILNDPGHGRMTVSRIRSIEEVYEVGVFMPHTLTGDIVVDGVVASELTEFVPRWAVGHGFQRLFNAFVSRVLIVVPRDWEDRILSTVGTMVHGQADIQLNRDAFFSGLVHLS